MILLSVCYRVTSVLLINVITFTVIFLSLHSNIVATLYF